VLLLFGPKLEPHAKARFIEELRWLGRIFGEARDWDVFCSDVLVSASEDGVAASWLDLLRAQAADRRAAAHACVADVLGQAAPTATVLGLAAWDPTDGAALHAPLADIAPRLLKRLEDRVLRRGRHIKRCTDEELHALRKALKKLRYSVELLAPLPLNRNTRVQAYLHGCKKLLKHLGRLNDAGVAVALAEQLGGDRRTELAPAVAALAGWTADRQDEVRQRLRKDWTRFKAAPLPR
jgi:CHAD domain-containing protein